MSKPKGDDFWLIGRCPNPACRAYHAIHYVDGKRVGDILGARTLPELRKLKPEGLAEIALLPKDDAAIEAWVTP